MKSGINKLEEEDKNEAEDKISTIQSWIDDNLNATKEEYLEKYLKINQRNVFKYLFFEEQNGSSIKNCIELKIASLTLLIIGLVFELLIV